MKILFKFLIITAIVSLLLSCGGKEAVKKEEFDPVVYLKKADELVSKRV